MIRILRQFQDALTAHHPVVALESSVLAQGLPVPANRQAADRMAAAVAAHGAVAAIVAVVRGTPTVGLEPDELDRFLRRDGVRKVAARDLAPTIVAGADGATTVSATLAIASQAQVAVFATGGIGGVHRGAPFDESSDLVELARTPMVVVCAGAKSILDVPATFERLETLGIPVIGFRTDEFPGFFTASTGIRLGTSVDTAAELAAIFLAHRRLKRKQAVLVVQPPPPHVALERDDVDRVVAAAISEATSMGIGGAALTPFLLGAVTRLTDGRSLEANIALLEANSALAADVATICCEAVGDTLS